jgi:hypothetical protein
MTPSPVATITREQLALCPPNQQRRFVEYQRLGFVKIIDSDPKKTTAIASEVRQGVVK